jgi:hypothetical protein
VTPDQVPDDLPAPPAPVKPEAPSTPAPAGGDQADLRPRTLHPNLFSGLARLVRS